MRQFVVLFLIFTSLVFPASATVVTQEDVKVDLENSRVQVDLRVQELTSTHLTYFTTYRIDDVEVSADGERLNCDVDSSSIESEISCDINQTENFHAHFNFTTERLVQDEQDRHVFEYTQDFIRPTLNYSLSVTLPQGNIVAEQEDVSRPVITPSGAEISTNGQLITVKWNVRPPEGETLLGDTTNFNILYRTISEEDQNGIPIETIFVGLVLAVLVVTAIALGRRFFRKSVEDEFDELSDDQIELIDLLRENEGSMLQKDIVNTMDYSKAKVSGIVKELVENEILEKEKEGRSNRLKISRKYSY